MRHLTLTFLMLTAFLLGASRAFGVYQVGDPVPNLCWNTSGLSQVCLDYAPGVVRVLLFNAGWCGPCNEEFKEIGPKVKEFDGKPVIFVSLSSDGWTNGSKPDSTFLREWEVKHNIPFLVAASPKDAGKKFFDPPLYIPNVAIIGKDGKLAYKAVNPGVSAVFEEVRKHLKN